MNKDVFGIYVEGARENNLKNISVFIPHNKLVVITGLSGSGKSSLAFDTIYAEAQRRYLETFSAYARQFIGKLERPDVERITGLSPAVAIEQKTISQNPRSTVGTVTEIYDFFRLLYARVSTAYSYVTNKPMVQMSYEQILEAIQKKFNNRKIHLLAPLVKGRKGHYRELFENLMKKGFLKVRVDGSIIELTHNLRLDRYKIHDIDLLVDTILVSDKNRLRLENSLKTTLKNGKEQVIVWDEENNVTSYYSRNLVCEDTGISYDPPEPNTFSFNSPYGACENCNGLGYTNVVDINKVFPDPALSIREGGIAPLGKYKRNWLFIQLEALAEKYKFSLDTPIGELPEEVINLLLNGSNDVFILKNEVVGIYYDTPVRYEGIISYIEQQNNEYASKELQKWALSFIQKTVCKECNGARLKKSSLFFKINGKNIAEVSDMQFDELYEWLNESYNSLNERQKIISKDIVKEINHRIKFLLEVGLNYLTLSRPSRSLSGGESQRIRLATQIASNLTGVLYILDEPSIGLHPRDNKRLIDSLKRLRDKENSIIVVEHDEEMMLSADYIIDMGPGSGEKGGYIVGCGTPEEMKKCNSLTCQYLRKEKTIPVPSKRRKGSGKYIELMGCSGNNLKNIDLKLPLEVFVCVTGVSGSGKSTLINETLYPLLSNKLHRSNYEVLPYKEIIGIENINKVINVDQEPIGKSTRSNPATYTKVFDLIRKLYASTIIAKMRGYKEGRFSFNVSGGRCEKCKGAGYQIIEMGMLPTVKVVCPDCKGKRFNRETLEVRYKGKSIADVLEMTVDHAIEFFDEHPSIKTILFSLKQVGLGYLKLGQETSSLSGGENQRVKLAAEFARKDTGKTLYILDEPTTGLHFEDISVLLNIINSLVDRGNTVVVIEHNIDVIKSADYIIDLGPEGGAKGGEIIDCGTPEQIAMNSRGYTSQYLRFLLKDNIKVEKQTLKV